ncbi:hypothetical protein H6768_01940 [Candidatus Peribacteria bacterium]|nr:hypothetical protein [Candidatus Peribacteria bacterium]
MLRFLRQQRKKNIVLPHRLAQIITDQMDGIENDISLLSSRLEQKLESRDSCPENERTALSQEIDNLLREIQILNDKISEMHASFNCSSLILSEEGEEDEPNYNNDGDENG